MSGINEEGLSFIDLCQNPTFPSFPIFLHRSWWRGSLLLLPFVLGFCLCSISRYAPFFRSCNISAAALLLGYYRHPLHFHLSLYPYWFLFLFGLPRLLRLSY